MVSEEISSGKILVAEPFMIDPNFRRSTVLLCDHGEGGSIGFIMNKQLNMSVDELIEDFPNFDSEVFYGGPVKTDTIHYIHNRGDLVEGAVEVADGVYWGGNFEKLKLLIASNLILPEHIRFFIGYSSWADGQLLDEMSYGSWLMANMHANYLFTSEPENLWQQVLTNKGDTYTVIAQMPDDFSWN